jgi:molecular chaperone GrpE
MKSPEEESTGPVIRDLRRIDPETGQVRDPGRPTVSQPAPGPASPQAAARPGRHAASRPGGVPGRPGMGGMRDRAAGPGPQAEPPVTPPPVTPPPAAPHAEAPTAAPGPAAPGPASPPPPGDHSGGDVAAALALAERTADLQRLQAEYANYRKRVERDRAAVRDMALANVLGDMLPVLDNIGRAREHGELTGGFKSVADSLEAALTKLGLTSYGEDGDPFDPNLHEALMHSYSPDVTEATCVRILQPGYTIGGRTLRPARVAVAEPESPASAGGPGGGSPVTSDPD